MSTEPFVIVGSAPCSDMNPEAPEGHRLFLRFEEALAALGDADAAVQSTVIIDDEVQEIWTKAWSLTNELVDHLVQALPDYPHLSDLLRLTRRQLYMQRMMGIVSALTQAELVKRLVPAGSKIQVRNATTSEKAALLSVLPSAECGAATAAARRTAGRLRAVAKDVMLLLASVPERLSLARTGVAANYDGAERWVNFFIASPAHENIVGPVVAELRQAGWQARRVDISAQGTTLASPSSYDDTCSLATYLPGRNTTELSRRRMKAHAGLAREVRGFCQSRGMAAFADDIITLLTWHLSVVQPSSRDGLARLAKSKPAQVNVTLDETNYRIEALALLSRDGGTPVVNVQHGIITSNPLRSEFTFDAFCVFGEATKDMLARLGTSEEVVRVVGDPRLDSVNRRQFEPSGLDEDAVRGRLGLGTDRVIVYAAQHTDPFISSAALYEALALTCAAVRRLEAVRLIVKLHPHGAGTESAYQEAIDRCGDDSVVSVRDEDLLGLISLSSCVVTYTSSVGFETVALRRPLVIADVHNAARVTPFVEEGVAMAASTVDEMERALRVALEGAALSEDALARVDVRYSGPLEGGAAARIAAVVKEFV